MSDELEWARKVCDSATASPWEVDRPHGDVEGIGGLYEGVVELEEFSYGMETDHELAVSGANADTIALLGTIRAELLDVALAVSQRHDPCDEHLPRSAAARACPACHGDRMREATVARASHILRTAIQTHRERTET